MMCAAFLLLLSAAAATESTCNCQCDAISQPEGCKWNWKEMRCLPADKCEFQYKLGGKRCRTKATGPENETEAVLPTIEPQNETVTLSIPVDPIPDPIPGMDTAPDTGMDMGMDMMDAAPSDAASWAAETFGNDGHFGYQMLETATEEPDYYEAPTFEDTTGGEIKFEAVQDVETLVVLGAGPAGLSAGIYAARAGLTPLVVSVDNGQLDGKAGEVENYPSCLSEATGPSIINSFMDQAKRFGTRFLNEEVKGVTLANEPYRFNEKLSATGALGSLRLSSGPGNTKREVLFKALIVATGASTKWLHVPGEEDYSWGKGVASCATCDGFFFRNRDVVVIGGGDTAMEEALYLVRICKSVTVIHRKDRFSASKIMAQRVLDHQRITVLWNTTVASFGGDTKQLTHVVTTDTVTGEEGRVRTDGAFVAIGHQPNTKMLEGLGVDMDEAGYIVTGGQQHGSTATSLEGIYAAGDVADRVYRQAVTSAGAGAKAALDAERWLCRLGC